MALKLKKIIQNPQGIREMGKSWVWAILKVPGSCPGLNSDMLVNDCVIV
jgi:hypothetical protein